MMQLRLFAFICIICAPGSSAQAESDEFEAAKLGVIEKLYEVDEPQVRASFAGKGKTEKDISDILYVAYDRLAACLVDAARAQAREQGLPQKIILKGIGDLIQNEEESMIFLKLDSEALHVKERLCNATFNDRIAIATRS